MNMNMMIIPFLTLMIVSSSFSSLAQVPPSPSPSPSPSSTTADCVTVLFGLSDCIPYVTGNGTVAPTPQCCNELSGVFDSEPICLCELYDTSLVGAYGINYTAAYNLPSSCNLTKSLPTTSECQAAGIPVAAPSPSASSIQSPGTSPSPSQSLSGDTLVPPPSSTNTTNTTSTTPSPSPNSASQPPYLDMINGVASMFMLIITVLLV